MISSSRNRRISTCNRNERQDVCSEGDLICLLYSLMSAVNAVADAALSAVPLCLFLAMGIAAARAKGGLFATLAKRQM